MPFTSITKPTQGDAVKKSLIDSVIDDLGFLNTEISGVKVVQIPNPSFEIDSDSDGIPDRWTRTLYTGGAFSLSTTAADVAHGARGIKFTHPSGGSNGGGYITSEDFFEVSEYQRLLVSWLHFCSVTGMHDLVEILFYDKDQNSVSTTTLYDSVANPTAWSVQSGICFPPVTARYAKLRITGGKNDVDPLSSAVSHWDNVRIVDSTAYFTRAITFGNSGTHNWIAPSGITKIRIRAWGGGGGGGGSAGANGACGGGGGEYVEAVVTVVAATDYTVVIGAGGTFGGAGATSGTNGSDTTFATTTVIAMGGSGGGASGGAGGAGGTGGTGNIKFAGLAGEANSGSTYGGAGGASLGGGAGGRRRTSAGNGYAGESPGGGGGGCLGPNTGATAGDGQMIIEY